LGFSEPFSSTAIPAARRSWVSATNFYRKAELQETPIVSPELIQTMRAALDEIMTKMP